MKYNMVIIGAGSIGALKPKEYDYPGGDRILTIAHAAWKNADVNLIGIVDTNSSKAIEAKQKWQTTAYADLDEIKERIDIIAVCTPTDTHYEVLKKAIARKPKLIIAEKPFCTHLHEAKEISELARQNGVLILVDYIRRFDPITRIIRDTLNDLIDGNPQKIHHAKLTYTRGIFHEACHAMDLFLWFFGNYKGGRVFAPIIADKNKDDFTYPGFFQFERCERVFLCPVDGRDYAIFEIDIFSETGRVVLAGSGTEAQFYNPGPDIYGDYNRIHPAPTKVIPTLLTSALSFLMRNAVGFLNGEEELYCTDKDAIEVHKIYCEI